MVNDEVRNYMTPRGVEIWWAKAKIWDDGRTPQEAWDAGDKELVYRFAQSGRDMIAT